MRSQTLFGSSATLSCWLENVMSKVGKLASEVQEVHSMLGYFFPVYLLSVASSGSSLASSGA